MILDTRGFKDFQEWADRASFILSRYGTIPEADGMLDWKVWANAVVQLIRVGGQVPPSPQFYPSWEKWATDFNMAVILPVG